MSAGGLKRERRVKNGKRWLGLDVVGWECVLTSPSGRNVCISVGMGAGYCEQLLCTKNAWKSLITSSCG